MDTYGHLIPGADVAFADRLDEDPTRRLNIIRQPSATPAQPEKYLASAIPSYAVDFIGGGGQDRTADLRVMKAPISNAFNYLEVFEAPLKPTKYVGNGPITGER